MQIAKDQVAGTLALLRHHGYTVEVVPVGRAGRRVVLRYGEERWQIEAASTGEALGALLDRMLPSSITKALFAEAMKPPVEQVGSPARSASPSRATGPAVHVVRRRVG